MTVKSLCDWVQRRPKHFPSWIRILVALCFLPNPGHAQLLVTNDNPSGAGSLLNAVTQAALTPNSLIEFSGIDGNITLGSALSVSNSPTINAAGTTALTIPDAITLAGPLILNMSGVTGTVSGAITDGNSPGSLSVQDTVGGGVLILSGANGYSGGTTIGSGATVGVNNGGSLGTGTLTFDGGALQTQAAASFTNAVSLSGAGTVNLDGNSTTLSGPITGAGPLNVINSTPGNGILSLSGSNSYTGGTTVNTGAEVGINGNGGLGTGALTFNGGTLQTQAALSIGNAVTLTGAGTVDLYSYASAFTGGITGGGALTITDSSSGGGGILTLNGTNNSYTGGTTINTGATASVNNNGSLGTGALTFNGGTLQTNAGLSNFTNGVALAGAGTVDLDGNASTFSGGITGAGALTITNSSSGGGTLTLNSANSNNTGGINIGAPGALGSVNVLANAADSLGSGGVSMSGANGTSLNLEGFAETIGSLSGDANSTLNLDGAPLRVGANGTSTTFAGLIEDTSGAGNGVLEMSGDGTLVLSGNNTYAGGTNLSAGTIGVQQNGSLGTGLATFNGGTLQTQAALSNFGNAVTLNAGGGTVDLDGNASTFTGGITGAGALTITNSASGGGTLTLNGVNGYTGGTTINTGATASVNNNGSLGTGALTFNGGTLQTNAGLSNFTNGVALTGAGTVDLDGKDSTFSGAITGAGPLTITDNSALGGGALTLTGANGNTGGINITAGAGGGVSVVAGASGALGSGLVSMSGANGTSLNLAGNLETISSLNGDANSTLDLDGATLNVGGGGTFAGVLKDTLGTGALVMSGGGIFVVSGNNTTYSDATSLQAGTLAVTNNNSLGTSALTFNGGTLQTQAALSNFGNAATLTEAGTMDLDGYASTFSGAITGAGALTVTDSSAGGGGALTLTGANGNTGGIDITAGAGAGGVSVLASAAGSLGTGRVTMTGGTSQASLNLEDAAETIGSLSGDANSTLNLNGANLTMGGDGTSTSFAGTIEDTAGTGALIKSGNGTFVLSGSWNNAATEVGAGTFQLAVNTNYTGTLSVDSGGTFDLNGFNQTGTGAIVNNGTIKTGAGTLAATSYGGGGILSVALQPSAASLNVSGNANVAGGALSVSNHPTPGAYTVINAGTLSGEFSSISLSPDYKETSVYSGDKLTLTLVPTLASGVQSLNQRAVGSALFNISGAAAGDLRAVLNQLDSLPSSQANTALDQISPMSLVAMGAMEFSASSLQASAVSRHLADLPVGGADSAVVDNNPYPGVLIASAGVGDTPEPWHDSVKTKDIGEYFATATGSEGQINPVNGASGAQPGYKFSSGGATIGANTPGDQDLVLGLALGFVGSSADVGSGEGDINSQSLRGGVFAARRIGDLHGNIYLGGAIDSFSVTRNIDSLGRNATSTPTGSEVDFLGQASYDLHLRRATFSPSVSLSSDHLTIDPTKESGAGAMDLSIGQQEVYSLRSDAGAKFSYRFGGDRRSLTPYVSAAYEHEFMDQSRDIDAQFISGAGGPFTVTTADIARSGVLLAAGLSMDWRNGASLQLEYSADSRPNYDINTLLINFRARFQ